MYMYTIFKIISGSGKLASPYAMLYHRASVWKLRLFSIYTLPIADFIQSHEFKLHLYDNDSPIWTTNYNLCLKFLVYISLPLHISTWRLMSISDLTCPKPNSFFPVLVSVPSYLSKKQNKDCNPSKCFNRHLKMYSYLTFFLHF